MFEGRTQQSEQLMTEGVDEWLQVRSSQCEKKLLEAEGREDATHGGDRKKLKDKKNNTSHIFLWQRRLNHETV